ncbi:hypothetical protein [Paenibacillus sp. FSL E2-0178]|uniref:hypothetical protein n=1 Tax=Paenibacillus sp. FSL E2-0178 TaxID=2921361 RepID=UPI003158733F
MVTYKYMRSGGYEEMQIKTIERAMGLAALNFRENVEPIEIVDDNTTYSKVEIKNYIRQNNII